MPEGTSPEALLPLSALPSLPTVPLLNSLPWLLRPEGVMNRLLVLSEGYREVGAFRSPMPDGHTPVFVCNASLATELCDESRFEKVLDGPLVHIRDFAGDGLFTARSDEPNWHHAHRILSPGFSSGSMDRYFPAMRAVLESMLERWRRSPGPVDVVPDVTKLTLDTIALTGFDYRFDSFAKPALHPFLQALGRALQECVDVLQRPAFARPFFYHRRVQYRLDIETMSTLVDAVIQQRRGEPQERWPRDFLSLMLSQADPKTGERLSSENIRYQILTFLIAGHETTSGLLAFTLHQLASDPALCERLRAEVRGSFGDGEPTMKQVLELDLVHRVLSEALRLRPTVPAVTRGPKQDDALGGRYFLPRGQPLGILLHAVHRDPAVWPEPSRFDPDRFLPEAVKSRPAGAYKPFGIGRRACTGRHFALVEAALCLALLVREFDFDPPGPLVLAPTISPKPKGFRLGLRRRRA